MPPQVVGRHHHLGTQMPSGGVHPITAPLGPAECVVHLGRSYPREDPSCSGLVPTEKTTLNPAHVRPERRALHNEPRLDDTIRPRTKPPSLRLQVMNERHLFTAARLFAAQLVRS